jgi:hypothetical protein
MAYRQQTAPLIAYYRDHGILRSIDGMVAIERVAEAIEQALNALAASPVPVSKPPARPAAKPAVKSTLKSAAKPALKTSKPASKPSSKSPSKSPSKSHSKPAVAKSGRAIAKAAARIANIGKKSKSQTSNARRGSAGAVVKPSARKTKSRLKARSAATRKAARRPR